VSDDETTMWLKCLDKSCANGPSALLAVFNAALTGFIANKDFHGPEYQGSAKRAVQFALQVLKEAQ